jgi:hypothetical protein
MAKFKLGGAFPWEAPLVPQKAVTTEGYDGAPLGGKCGILSGAVLEPPTQPARLRQDDPQPVFDLIKLGGERQAEIQASNLESDLAAGLEAAIRPHLKAELAAELDGGGSAEQRRKDIGLLKAVCAKWSLPLNLPHEPAPWAAVAALLIEQDGIEEATRLRNSISFSHRSLNLSDPTSDHVINAVLRSIANRKDPAPAE